MQWEYEMQVNEEGSIRWMQLETVVDNEEQNFWDID